MAVWGRRRKQNEAAFPYQLFVRRFGTNNSPDCSNLCHERRTNPAAMSRLRLTVGITTKLNRGYVLHDEQALILPCLARSDL
jgi:hypothetical protein